MYVKLFDSILTSSMWAEDAHTRIVWITLLTLADKDGYVRGVPSALARLANVSPSVCNKALEKFIAPEEVTRTECPFQGRRIERVNGGWLILKYDHYRAIRDEETRKEQWRNSSKTYRQRQKTNRKTPHADRQQTSAKSAHAAAAAVAPAVAEKTGEKGRASRSRPAMAPPSKNQNTAQGEAILLVAELRAHAAPSGGQDGGKRLRPEQLENLAPETRTAVKAMANRILTTPEEKLGLLANDLANAIAAATARTNNAAELQTV